jgi:hypothetical protein
VEKLVQGSIEWFKSKIGLSMEGLDVRKELNESRVSMEECECLWGARKLNNGFKVISYKEASLVVRVRNFGHLFFRNLRSQMVQFFILLLRELLPRGRELK